MKVTKSDMTAYLQPRFPFPLRPPGDTLPSRQFQTERSETCLCPPNPSSPSLPVRNMLQPTIGIMKMEDLEMNLNGRLR